MSERIVNDPSLHGWVEVNGKWVWDGSGSGGGGAGMVISDSEPTDKVEGMQWLNPTTGLVLFWDDEKWLQMPTTGAPGADGNIADGSQDNVIATWDSTAGQWTPNGNCFASNGGLVTAKGGVVSESTVEVNRASNPNVRLTQPGRSWDMQVKAGGELNFLDRTAGADRLTIDSTGNVGIGTTGPDHALDVRAGDAPNTVQASFGALSGDRGLLIKTYTNNAANAGVEFDARGFTSVNGEMRLSTNSTPALTIGSTGDATFSGNISANNISASNSVSSGSNLYVNAPAGGTTKPRLRYSGVDVSGEFCIRDDDAGVDRFKISKEGNATFGGTVTANRLVSNAVPANSGGFVSVLGNGSDTALIPVDGSGAATDGAINLGRTHQGAGSNPIRFKNAYFSGTVSDGTGRLMSSRHLIETLSTLRTATQDETVDVRQALASACDKLIEKFEAMQSTATQEISDE